MLCSTSALQIKVYFRQRKWKEKNLGYCSTGRELNNLFTGQDAEAPDTVSLSYVEILEVLCSGTIPGNTVD